MTYWCCGWIGPVQTIRSMLDTDDVIFVPSCCPGSQNDLQMSNVSDENTDLAVCFLRVLFLFTPEVTFHQLIESCDQVGGSMLVNKLNGISFLTGLIYNGMN